MLTAEQRKQMSEQGYLVFEPYFNDCEIERLTSIMDGFAIQHQEELRKVGTQGISRANEISFYNNIAQQKPEVKEFVTQDRLLAFGIELIGPDLTLHVNQLVYKYPEAAKDFPWHQDNGYRVIEPEEYLSCWIALSDATTDNGCLWVLPGSHRQGLIPHEDTPIGKQCYFGSNPGVAVQVKKGGLVIFSSMLVHRSGPNRSKDVRKSFLVQYTDASVVDVDTGQSLNRMRVAVAGAAV
jgi:phytanoyl-CoA hydroxylase